MRIEGAAAEYFAQWIGGALKPLLDEDADTDVLSKYIITLLSTDDNEEQLREHCVAQLTDFLSDETEKFVANLFDAIKRSPYKEGLRSESYRHEAEGDQDLYRFRRGRRGDSDDGGSDDERRYRRAGGRRGYEDSNDGYDHSSKRRRGGDHGSSDRYMRSDSYGDRRGQYSDNRYDRFDKGSDRSDHRSRGGIGSWDRGEPRPEPEVERPARLAGGPAPLPPRGPVLIPSYPPSRGMSGDGYMPGPFYGGGGGFVGMPPHPGGYHGSFGPYDPYDPNFQLYQPVAPPPPPMPRMMVQGLGDRPPPPPFPRASPVHSQLQGGYNGFNNNFGDETGNAVVLDGIPVTRGEESHTVRCTGIPQSVQEKDLFRHFKAFGRIASLKLLRQPSASGGDNGDGGKVYNECYVQFIDPANAKKCVVAPSAVLNNRYIKIFISNVNVLDPADAVDVNVSFSKGYDGAEGNSNNPRDRAQRDTLRKYEELKKLRSQEENILKKQEDLLEAQIEQHNKILAKLAEVDDSDEKSKMADTLEAKIMSLQFKLREVREKRETSRGSCEHYTSSDGVAKTTDVSGDSPSTSSSIARFSSQRGRATPRGRLGGRVALGGRGRGRFGRGGGNMSVDCRPKSLVVSDIPDGFDEVADQHFSRFGKVVNVEKQQNSAGLKIEFASRYEAERALKDGAGYGGAMLTLEWDSLQDLNSVSVQGYAETTNEADRN